MVMFGNTLNLLLVGGSIPLIAPNFKIVRYGTCKKSIRKCIGSYYSSNCIKFIGRYLIGSSEHIKSLIKPQK
ncbi:hypothetical protein Phi40:1_gp055 [Cellulophaga phage phi40:1]|uniref:Uncharacterized protein n=1 Tax=Cellulophaga phage phi38:1 TaxID=1327977 RepID=R9ZZZ2_9CAUD|nr:hypothetical protein Phi38:1_gp055 [Cellulophaga phage phi38:1]AGO47920.1 hypothetical protein Phi40:1_gp055 [Cellulophaga phage phi40:1]AGO48085.1 hypothetical protein Phi38:1_gp055 [Cellulophaga phage phi38:1]